MISAKHSFFFFLSFLVLPFLGHTQARTTQPKPYLKDIKVFLPRFPFSQDQFDSLGVPMPDGNHSTNYEVHWGKVERTGDSATVVLYTSLTGAIWDKGSMDRHGKRLALNCEVQTHGSLAAVWAETFFVYKIGGLQDHHYRVQFGRFSVMNSTGKVYWKPKLQGKHPTKFWI